MKFIFVFLSLTTAALAQGLNGVDIETEVEGTSILSKSFCAESLRDPKVSCEDWKLTVTDALISGVKSPALILKSECIERESIGCRSVGSFKGKIFFLR